MERDVEKLKEFVKRNEAYVESANWLTRDIDIIVNQIDHFFITGELPDGIASEEQLYERASELDRRAVIEEKVYKQLCDEQAGL